MGIGFVGVGVVPVGLVAAGCVGVGVLQAADNTVELMATPPTAKPVALIKSRLDIQPFLDSAFLDFAIKRPPLEFLSGN